MGVAYLGQVGENFVNATASTLAITTTAAANVGTFLVCPASVGAAASATSISDSAGNTWNLVNTSPLVARTMALFTCYVTSSLAASSTITITYSANTLNRLAAVYAFTGINRPTVTSATAQGTGVSTLNTGNLAPTQYASLLFTAISKNNNAAYTTPTGWTRLPLNVSNILDGYAYRIQPSTATQGTTWSWTGSYSAGQVSATFTPDGGDFFSVM